MSASNCSCLGALAKVVLFARTPTPWKPHTEKETKSQYLGADFRLSDTLITSKLVGLT